MERTTWGRINELFEAARRLPAGEREAWVRAATADERVQSEVLSLLRAHEDDPWCVDEPGGSRTPARVTQPEEWPGQPPPALPGARPAAPARAAQAPASPTPPRLRRAPEPKAGGEFATYRLIREVSRDQARITFEAVATGSGPHPRVALHVLAADAHDPVWSELLHAQGDILAHLDHPRIPRLLDGGVTADGTAYLAFEFAAGDPVDVWCRDRSLNVRSRVDLVVAVCEAVQHAHEHLLAHGNLRPANIIVSAAAEVKLLDFGMTTLLGLESDPGGAAAPVHQYMSPEQARGDVLTTASDVYALGILLYTLLTGYPPYEIGGLTPARAHHMICEIEPDVPSTVVGGRDRRALAGTLDGIILKALRKDPRERYATAAALAADLRAWRGGRPASVTPATPWSRMTAAGSGRNTRAGAMAAVIVALLGGAGVLGWQAYLLRGERDQARASLAESFRRLAELQAGAGGAGPTSLAAAGASLDAAITAGEQVLAADPRSLPAALALTRAYGDLVGLRIEQGDAGGAGRADARLRALVDQFARLHPLDVQARAAAASGYVRLGVHREAGGDAAAAKAMYTNAIAAFENLAAEGQLTGAGRADYARAQRRLGAIALQDGALDDAERLLLAAQAFDTDAAAPGSPGPAARIEAAQTANGLALVARQRGETSKAETLWMQAMTALQAATEADPESGRALGELARVRSSLGSLCRSQRRFEEGLAHYREALRARQREAGMNAAPPSASASLAAARIDVARLLLDLVEVRRAAPNEPARLREAGALLAQADPVVRASAPASPAEQDALAELDRQSERLRRLTNRLR
jgi:tetratricopeptide (TPR) repeat protein